MIKETLKEYDVVKEVLEYNKGFKVGGTYTYEGEDAGDPNNGERVKLVTKLTNEEATLQGFPKDAKEKGYEYCVIEFLKDGICLVVGLDYLVK